MSHDIKKQDWEIIDCSGGGLAPQHKGSAGWHPPHRASCFPVLGALQRLWSIHSSLTTSSTHLASAPTTLTPGPSHGLL